MGALQSSKLNKIHSEIW